MSKKLWKTNNNDNTNNNLFYSKLDRHNNDAKYRIFEILEIEIEFCK